MRSEAALLTVLELDEGDNRKHHGHNDIGNDVEQRCRRAGIDLHVDGQRTGKTEQQRIDSALCGRAAAAVDGGDGNEASAGGHVVGEQAQALNGKVDACQSAADGADGNGDVFIEVGLQTEALCRVLIFAYHADIDAEAGAVHEDAHDDNQHEGDIGQQRVTAQKAAQNGNVLNTGDVQLHVRRVEVGNLNVSRVHAFEHEIRHCRHQHIDCQTDDDDIALFGDAEQREDQSQHKGDKDCQKVSGDKAEAEIEQQHRRKRACEHHALQSDVEDVCLVSPKSAENTQQDWGGVNDGLVQDSTDQFHLYRLLFRHLGAELTEQAVALVEEPYRQEENHDRLDNGDDFLGHIGVHVDAVSAGLKGTVED